MIIAITKSGEVNLTNEMPDANIAVSSFFAYKSLRTYAVEKSIEMGIEYQTVFGM